MLRESVINPSTRQTANSYKEAKLCDRELVCQAAVSPPCLFFAAKFHLYTTRERPAMRYQKLDFRFVLTQSLLGLQPHFLTPSSLHTLSLSALSLYQPKEQSAMVSADPLRNRPAMAVPSFEMPMAFHSSSSTYSLL